MKVRGLEAEEVPAPRPDAGAAATSSTPSDGGERRFPRRLWWAAAAVLLVGFVAFQAQQLMSPARQGKQALIRAEAALRARDVDVARADLAEAKRAFTRLQHRVDRARPVLVVARLVPFVRIQARAVEVLSDTGLSVTSGGQRLADAADFLLAGGAADQPVASATSKLAAVRTGLVEGTEALDAGLRRLATLDGYRLVGPLSSARDDLVRRLPRLATEARAARDGVEALMAFSAVDGKRSYLLLSQNPDEVRPTGGYIGTYGLLTADHGKLTLDRYNSIESWLRPRPDAVVPAAQAPSAFRFPDPPTPQVIANVNTTPNWPDSARLAAELWRRGGEAPVDGAIGFTPDFLARLLTVTGPVDVPEFNERVTAANLVDRVDYWTHLEGSQTQSPTERKRFIAALAPIVLQRLLDAPARSLETLGRAVSAGLESRDVMVWVTDPKVAHALALRRWDGSLPKASGDFFYDGEFEYAAKNGRSLKRTFDHDVTLQADGSARVVTKISIANTAPFTREGFSNIDSLSYITVYGPEGATLDSASDPPDAVEPAIAGHPAAGWVRSAEPLGSTSLLVVWQVPNLAVRQADGSWRYRLTWFRLPAHAGDVLRLRVHLPGEWTWQDATPPETVALDRDFRGEWKIVARRKG